MKWTCVNVADVCGWGGDREGVAEREFPEKINYVCTRNTERASIMRLPLNVVLNTG